jgi:4-hydroxythreonine-4-phosphate dehydrogenase
METKIVITCGDPAGVGPEILAAWAGKHVSLAPRTIIVGPGRWLRETPSLAPFTRLEVGPRDFAATLGTPSEAGAAVALEALEVAADICQRGGAAAAVTGPVSKIWMQRVGFPFPGQTEFFADRWGGEPVMAFAGGPLRVVLATWHIPLGEVPKTLDRAILTRAIHAADRLARLGRADTGPRRIGVCGLNPHAGEEGLLGSEEREWIDPFLRELQGSFPALSLTQPGDTIFWRALRGEFDAVVALYHDQGLAPLKTVAFEESVNITLGLPFLRTSPDHGTGFAIAGQGKASVASFSRAVEIAFAGLA